MGIISLCGVDPSQVVMQSTMSCDHMGLGEQLIHCVDPIPCGVVKRILAVMQFYSLGAHKFRWMLSFGCNESSSSAFPYRIPV